MRSDKIHVIPFNTDCSQLFIINKTWKSSYLQFYCFHGVFLCPRTCLIVLSYSYFSWNDVFHHIKELFISSVEHTHYKIHWGLAWGHFASSKDIIYTSIIKLKSWYVCLFFFCFNALYPVRIEKLFWCWNWKITFVHLSKKANGI